MCAGNVDSRFVTELIDKCVGSRIWIVMKGDKGQFSSRTIVPATYYTPHVSEEPSLSIQMCNR